MGGFVSKPTSEQVAAAHSLLACPHCRASDDEMGEISDALERLSDAVPNAKTDAERYRAAMLALGTVGSVLGRHSVRGLERCRLMQQAMAKLDPKSGN